MERRKGNLKATKANCKAVTLKVPIGQNALVIEKMNNDKSMPKPKMRILSCKYEVATRREVFKCPGWCKFAIDLGLKPMPEKEKQEAAVGQTPCAFAYGACINKTARFGGRP